MKIVVLDGTHNKNGMTLKLVNAFLDGVKTKDPEVEIITHDLLNANIQFCKGCGKCTEDKASDNAECMIKGDDAGKIKNDALECDVLVFATPIYEYCVSSAMKRFLERCLTLVTFRMGVAPRTKAIKGKQAVVICSSGAPNPINHLMGITRYPKFILKLAAKLFRCQKTQTLFAGGMAIGLRMEKKWIQKANRMGVGIIGYKK